MGRVSVVKDGHSTYDTNLLPAEDVIAHHNALLRAFAVVVEADAIDFSSGFNAVQGPASSPSPDV